MLSYEFSDADFTVPSWIKNTAGWWADDQINDDSFVSGIQWLVTNDVIILPSVEQGEGSDNVIPGWIKNTAGWWAEDEINDATFIGAIKYLINEGIMVVKQVEVSEESAECTFKNAGVVPIPCPDETGVDEIKDFYIDINGHTCFLCTSWGHTGGEYYFQIETFDERRGSHIDGVTINAEIISKGGELRHDFGALTTEDGIYNGNITIPGGTEWFGENILSVTAEYNGIEKTIEKEFDVFMNSNTSGASTNSGVLQSKTLSPTNSTSDGNNSFVRLDNAIGVDTFTIGESTYAIIVGQGESGIQIINLSGLDIPSSALPFSGITASDNEVDGANSFTELGSGRHVATYTITPGTASALSLTSTNFAIVAGLADDGLQVIDIGVPTAIVAKDAETDDANGFDQLGDPFGVATFTISSNSTYRGAVVTGNGADSVTIVDITNPTAIFEHDVEVDGANSFTELEGARSVATWNTTNGNTYAIVASQADDGVQIIDISDPSNVVAKDAATDGVNSFTQLDGAFGVDTFTIGSSTYAIVTSVTDDGVQIIDITDPAAIVAMDAETDGENGFDELDGAADVSTFTCGKSTYAIVASTVDDGLQLIDISLPTKIIAIHSVTDGENGFTELDGTRGIEMVTVKGTQYAIVTATHDDGVQIVEPSCSKH